MRTSTQEKPKTPAQQLEELKNKFLFLKNNVNDIGDPVHELRRVKFELACESLHRRMKRHERENRMELIFNVHMIVDFFEGLEEILG